MAVVLLVDQVADIILPHRPNYGSMGKQVVVTANHYKADYNKNQMLYQYDVSLEGFEKTALVRQTRERKGSDRLEGVPCTWHIAVPLWPSPSSTISGPPHGTATAAAVLLSLDRCNGSRARTSEATSAAHLSRRLRHKSLLPNSTLHERSLYRAKLQAAREESCARRLQTFARGPLHRSKLRRTAAAAAAAVVQAWYWVATAKAGQRCAACHPALA